MGLQKVELVKVVGPLQDGASIFLGNEKKTFTMFIGLNEAFAIIRELQKQKFVRPLTHDLFHYTLIGFNIEIKRVVISSITENTYFATLHMEQKVIDEKNEWTGKRNEVRIDARPSDSIIMALKTGADIYITDEVFEQVKDVSEDLKNIPSLNFESGAIDPDTLSQMQFPEGGTPDIPDTYPETDEDKGGEPEPGGEDKKA